MSGAGVAGYGLRVASCGVAEVIGCVADGRRPHPVSGAGVAGYGLRVAGFGVAEVIGCVADGRRPHRMSGAGRAMTGRGVLREILNLKFYISNYRGLGVQQEISNRKPHLLTSPHLAVPR